MEAMNDLSVFPNSIGEEHLKKKSLGRGHSEAYENLSIDF